MFDIVTVEDRLKEPSNIKGVIIGKHGIGKTTLVNTLNPDDTLFVAIEEGKKAIDKTWTGSHLNLRRWPEIRNLAVALCGPDPAAGPNATYSKEHYDSVMTKMQTEGKLGVFEKFNTFFIDSISKASSLCLTWARTQPAAFTEKGKENMQGAYGLLGHEMLAWCNRFQYNNSKNIWLTAAMDEKLDDIKQKYYEVQVEGNKTTLELPGVFDEILCLAELPNETGGTYRGFVTQTINPWGLPAKDRSGTLEMIEPPHLAKLMDKINAGKKVVKYNYDIPGQSAELPTPTAN